MTKLVLRDCFIEVDDVNLSDHVDNVVINMTRPAVVSTAFGAEGRTSEHGVPTDSFTINFQQDFDTASVDATLWALYDGEDTFDVTVRPDDGAASATNPEYTGSCKLFNYEPLSGGVGDLSTTSVEFEVQGKIARSAGS